MANLGESEGILVRESRPGYALSSGCAPAPGEEEPLRARRLPREGGERMSRSLVCQLSATCWYSFRSYQGEGERARVRRERERGSRIEMRAHAWVQSAARGGHVGGAVDRAVDRAVVLAKRRLRLLVSQLLICLMVRSEQPGMRMRVRVRVEM